MSKAVVFRTSLAGYNKKDVNDYIRQRAEQTRAQTEEQKERIAQLSERLASCEKQAEEKKEELIGRLTEKSALLSERLEAVEQSVQGLFYELEQADRQVQKGMSDAEKAKKYDQLAQGLGQLLNLEMKAEESAEPVLADRSALKASVLQSLSGLSECLAQMKAAIATEE